MKALKDKRGASLIIVTFVMSIILMVLSLITSMLIISKNNILNYKAEVEEEIAILQIEEDFARMAEEEFINYYIETKNFNFDDNKLHKDNIEVVVITNSIEIKVDGELKKQLSK